MSKILIVEDNEENRILLKQILNHCGYEILEASDGRSGIESAGGNEPDMVLLDLQLPVMDGFAVIKELKKIPALGNMKIIAITAFAMKGDREKAIAAGFDEYITKPIDTRMLPCIIKDILSEVKS